MSRRMESWMIVVTSVLMTAIILIIFTKNRETDFQQVQTEIQKSMVGAAAHTISMDILKKHADVQLFAREYAYLINQLLRNPSDEQTADNIKARLKDRFDDYFTFTITDQQAGPLILDIESLVGEICQNDLYAFSSGMQHDIDHIQNRVYIHPQPGNYHYDVMVPLPVANGKPRIFFVSFYPADIVNTLKAYVTPGYRLLLVRSHDISLIEISDEGVRDHLSRDIRLSSDELRSINVYKDVPGTDWRLVALPDRAYEQRYVHNLWMDAGMMLLVIMLANLLVVPLLLKISRLP